MFGDVDDGKIKIKIKIKCKCISGDDGERNKRLSTLMMAG